MVGSKLRGVLMRPEGMMCLAENPDDGHDQGMDIMKSVKEGTTNGDAFAASWN